LSVMWQKSHQVKPNQAPRFYNLFPHARAECQTPRKIE
jgi:hypothetical protein